MSELIFVTTDNCELCNKAEKKIGILKLFFSVKTVDVQNEYKEYLLRVPVLIKNEKIPSSTTLLFLSSTGTRSKNSL